MLREIAPDAQGHWRLLPRWREVSRALAEAEKKMQELSHLEGRVAALPDLDLALIPGAVSRYSCARADFRVSLSKLRKAL